MIGTLVKERRKARGLTQTELARRTGLSQNYISKLEGGDIDLPQRGTLEVLAGPLGVTLAALYQAAGVLPAGEQSAPPPEVLDESPIADDLVVSYIENLPGEAFRERLTRLRVALPPASYRALCLRLYRAWVANGELALDAYGLGRS